MPERCTITITNAGISLAFDPELPEGPHKLTRVEALAAGAVLGIAKALTGKGSADVIKVLQLIDASRGGK